MKIRNKAFFAVIALGILIAAVLWLLGSLDVTSDTFEFFSSAAGPLFIATAFVGFACLFRGAFSKSVVEIKTTLIILGIGFIIISVFCLAAAIALPKNIVMPIVAIVIAIAFLVLVLKVRSRPMVVGDNNKPGYKTYADRKSEQENLEKLKQQENSVNENNSDISAKNDIEVKNIEQVEKVDIANDTNEIE